MSSSKCPDCGWEGDHAPGCSNGPIIHTDETAVGILHIAADLISGDRAKTHGDLRVCHERIAALWSAYLGQTLTGADVARLMVLLKVARSRVGSENPDDYIDMAGYAGIAGELDKN